ncbi:MAG: phosphoglucosamine mutase [Anaerolineales bacterium]
MGRLFGTDGIRGVVNDYPLTVEFAVRIGEATGHRLKQERERPAVVVGRDPRLSGQMLEHALAAGLTCQGVDVRVAGVLPTPGIAHLARTTGADLGIMISASHNPFHHNGIKLFDGDGYKIADELAGEIEALLLDGSGEFEPAPATGLGRSHDDGELRQRYVDHLVDRWAHRLSLEGLRLVVDCANGATSAVAPEVFGSLGADLILVENEPDGVNINAHYEYIYPRRLSRQVRDAGADAGIAFDGDGDRVMCVDEEGGFVDGDAILAILARDMQARGKLEGQTVVGTPMSNWGLKACLEEVGVALEETQVGDRFVLQRMLERGYVLGGEQSGHVLILHEGQTTGDGLYTALALLDVVVRHPDRSLAALAGCFEPLPEFLMSVEVPAKPPLEELPEIQEALTDLHARLGDDVDVNVRYSGTEEKLRLKIRAGKGHTPQSLEEAGRALMTTATRVISGDTVST